ncbi:MAG TPA: LON peptidase substrate-binding domain-containing protein [Pyrinomonadaceae bacterium]|jgi:Lon protease-like protein|nr:LON peptidase substrate-binding domain-containing protein [Pyrinomonadaceae bacterium]
MSDALDRVIGVKQLPLFPLPVVLFPNTPLPLHIFEGRYRRMLKDIQITNNLFGLPFFDASAQESSIPAIGSIGCVAELRDIQELPDERSNIMTVGVIRFRLEDYVVTDDPYMVGEVSYFEDEKEDEELLQPRARVVQDLFMRVARAARKLAGEPDDLPELPDVTPEQLSFFIAAAVEFDIKLKLEMLEMRSTSERLKRLHDFLSQAVQSIEERANMTKIAQTNGHGKRNIDFE